jgi:hypothetical protein
MNIKQNIGEIDYQGAPFIIFDIIENWVGYKWRIEQIERHNNNIKNSKGKGSI